MSRKLKAVIKKIRKGDEIQVFLNDGYIIKRAEKNGYLIKSEDVQSKPVFVEFQDFFSRAKYDEWTEIEGQGV